MIRPSSLPMLAACPCFESSGGSEYTDEGNIRHKALAAYLNGDEKAFADLDEATAENLVWAAEYVKLKAPTSEYPMVFETHRTAVLPNGLKIEGTPDITCGRQLFDLKWRVRDYRAQMACYSRMMLAENPKIGPVINVHLLFAESQYVQTLKFDDESSWDLIKTIIDKAADPFAVPTPNSFCGWCAKQIKCPAIEERLNTLIEGRPDWKLQNYHASEVTDADSMGSLLRLARTVAGWAEGVEHHAKELALKQGLLPTGFKLQTRRGNRFIENLAAAFARMGMPQDLFLQACSCKPKALFDAHAKLHGMKKAAAERDAEQRLGELIQRKPSSQFLVSESNSPE